MPLFPALTVAETAALQGAVAIKTWLNYAPLGAVFASGTVVTSFTDPVNTVECSSTTVNWLNIQPGWTVWVGSAPGLHDRGIYRVRLQPTDHTAISIGEASYADPGLIPQARRDTGITAGDWLGVYPAYATWPIPPRILYTGGTTGVFYKDYAVAWTDQTSLPEAIINLDVYKPNGSDPDIYVGSHAATWLDVGQSYATLKFTVDNVLWPTSSSITTYTNNFSALVGGGTITLVSGSYTAPPFTVQMPAGVYIWTSTITENNGKTTYGYRYVWVNDGITVSPISITSADNDVIGMDGTKITITLNDDALSNLPDGTLVQMWDQPYINDVPYAVPTMTSQFTGWMFHKTPSGAAGLRQAQADFVGPQALLANMGMVSQVMDQTSPPTNWQQCVPDLANINFFMWYLLRWQTGNVLTLFNYNPFTTDATLYRHLSQNVTNGTVWDQLTKLAYQMVGCNIGCDRSGAFWVRQPLPRVPVASRSSLPTRDTLNASLIKDYSLPQRTRPTISLLHGGAFYTDGVNNFPLEDSAFGLARAGGSSEQTISFIANSQDEIDKFIGNLASEMSSPYEDGTLTIEQFRSVYEPAQCQKIAIFIAAQCNPDGVDLTVNALVKSVSIKRNPDGSADLSLTVQIETSGLPAATVAVPAAPPPGSQIQPPPAPGNTTPPGGDGHNGGWVIVFEAGQLRLTENWFDATPVYSLLSTSSTDVFDADPFCAYLGPAKSGSLDGFGAFEPGGSGTSGGVSPYYFQDILGTPSSTAGVNYTPGSNSDIVSCECHASTDVPGRFYICVTFARQSTHVIRYSAYGATRDYVLTAGQTNSTFEIDHYNQDEVLFTNFNGSFGGGIGGYDLNQYVAGSFVRTLKTAEYPYFWTNIQKPLYTLSGARNSSTHTGELIYALGGAATASGYHLFRTTSDNTHWIDITPAGHTLAPLTAASQVATDNANIVWAVDSDTRTIWVSYTAGASWTSYSSGLPSNLSIYTGGYFPTQISGQYVLYLGTYDNTGAGGVPCYSPSFGTAFAQKGGATYPHVSTVVRAFPLY